MTKTLEAEKLKKVSLKHGCKSFTKKKSLNESGDIWDNKISLTGDLWMQIQIDTWKSIIIVHKIER